MLDLDYNIIVAVGKKDISIRELLDVDDADLSNEFAAQSARYAYFAVLAARAKQDWQGAVDARKREEATAFVEFKSDKELVPPGSRTVTDGLANNYVDMDDRVAEFRNTAHELETRYRVMEAIARSLEMRANMLQSIGADRRKEQEMTGMHVDNPSEKLKDTIRKRNG
jgi:hypothetical protein